MVAVGAMQTAQQSFDAIVVGAGYIGSSAAYHPSKAGFKTALLDQVTLAAGASRANYGNIQIQDLELAHSIMVILDTIPIFDALESAAFRSTVIITPWMQTLAADITTSNPHLQPKIPAGKETS
jgi:2-polyprenyl-6-methoxyphenol hydroxylase-like FAD-dependent oxidoreductase